MGPDGDGESTNGVAILVQWCLDHMDSSTKIFLSSELHSNHIDYGSISGYVKLELVLGKIYASREKGPGNLTTKCCQSAFGIGWMEIPYITLGRTAHKIMFLPFRLESAKF